MQPHPAARCAGPAPHSVQGQPRLLWPNSVGPAAFVVHSLVRPLNRPRQPTSSSPRRSLAASQCSGGCQKCNSRAVCTKCYSLSLTNGRCTRCIDPRCDPASCPGNPGEMPGLACPWCRPDWGWIGPQPAASGPDPARALAAWRGERARCCPSWAAGPAWPAGRACTALLTPPACPSAPAGVCRKCREKGYRLDPATSRCIPVGGTPTASAAEAEAAAGGGDGISSQIVGGYDARRGRWGGPSLHSASLLGCKPAPGGRRMPGRRFAGGDPLLRLPLVCLSGSSAQAAASPVPAGTPGWPPSAPTPRQRGIHTAAAHPWSMSASCSRQPT